jgi:hypothetical protein
MPILEASAPKLNIQLEKVEVRPQYDLERAFLTLRQRRVGAVLVIGSPTFFRDQAKIAELAIRHHLPAGGSVSFVTGGLLLGYGVPAQAFFARVLAQARQRGLLSDEHFTVDGTLIEAWASLKSFKKKDAPPARPDDPGNPTVNFHGEHRSNATHVSTTDPEARLARKAKGHEAKLAYQGHVLMENRHGLAVEGCVTRASDALVSLGLLRHSSYQVINSREE